MALTLSCSCSADVSICNLTQLIWNIQIDVVQNGSVAALSSITLIGAHGSFVPIFLGGTPGHYETAVDLTPLGDWLSPFAAFWMDASTFQIDGKDFTVSGHDSIDAIYQCINVITGSVTKKTVTSTSNVTDESKCQTGDNDIRSRCGGIGGTLFKSTPLGACNGCTSSAADYEPTPSLDISIDTGESSQICLCATGGSGNYTFSIVAGSLPCGQTLNATTGCIEGDPDGSCDGSASITFRVTDAGVAIGPSGGVTIGGTCQVFGPSATRISGGGWTDEMISHTISLGGVDYTITGLIPTSPSNAGVINIDPTDGIVNPQSWSYTSPPTPAPPPGPPQIAEVTCTYLPGCPTGDSGLGGNHAF